MRHQLTQEERVKGGKNQPRAAKVEGGRKGFWVTYEKNPWFARTHLRYQPGMKKERQGHCPIPYEEM